MVGKNLAMTVGIDRRIVESFDAEEFFNLPFFLGCAVKWMVMDFSTLGHLYCVFAAENLIIKEGIQVLLDAILGGKKAWGAIHDNRNTGILQLA
jgi:hypothetical protein